MAKGIGQVIVFIKEHIEDKKNDNVRGWGEWIHLVYGILLIVAGVFLVGELGITSLAVLWMVGFGLSLMVPRVSSSVHNSAKVAGSSHHLNILIVMIRLRAPSMH